MKSPSKEAVKKPAVRKTTKGSSGVIHTSFTIPLFAASSICLKYSSEGSKPPQTYLHFALCALGARGAEGASGAGGACISLKNFLFRSESAGTLMPRNMRGEKFPRRAFATNSVKGAEIPNISAFVTTLKTKISSGGMPASGKHANFG